MEGRGEAAGGVGGSRVRPDPQPRRAQEPAALLAWVPVCGSARRPPASSEQVLHLPQPSTAPGCPSARVKKMYTEAQAPPGLCFMV